MPKSKDGLGYGISFFLKSDSKSQYDSASGIQKTHNKHETYRIASAWREESMDSNHKSCNIKLQKTHTHPGTLYTPNLWRFGLIGTEPWMFGGFTPPSVSLEDVRAHGEA